MASDLAVVCCHFNWCNFNTPVRNLTRFIKQMERDEISMYGVELSLTGEFATRNMPNWKHITVNKNNVCFQQYACINLLEKLVPQQYTKIAWIDHDITFMNRGWCAETSGLLDTYKLVQLFDTYIGTDRRGEEISKIDGCISAGSRLGKSGVAWAARRDLWNLGGGVYPYSVMGGGDTVFYHAIYDRTRMNKYKFIDMSSTRFVEWANKFESYVNREVSNVSGTVIHEWHGDLENKNYVTRHDIVKSIDLEKNITLNSDGLIEFVGVPDSFKSDVLEYFKNRNEDGEIRVDKST